MIKTKDITKFAKDIFSRNRGARRDGRLLHPERDWVLIITCFLVLFIAGSSISWWHFHTYRTLGDSIEGTNEAELPHFSTRAVQQINETYTSKEENFLQQIERSSENNSTNLEVDTEQQASADVGEDNGLNIEFDSDSAPVPAL